MKSHWLRDQRGSVLLFTTVIMVFLLVMGGIAIDLTYHGAVRNELQRSMDAAALAGAGNLGFNDTVFPTARQEAQRFGALNPYRVGPVNLNLNTLNDTTAYGAAGAPYGDIVLGIWNPDTATFEASLDGTMVNAVMCRYKTTIPTSFLRLLGFNTLPVQAGAIATSEPPEAPPVNACIAPIGLTDCPFEDSGSFSSNGCGEPVTFISSSGHEPILEGSGTNTGAWVNLDGSGTPNVPLTREALEAAFNGGGEGCSGTDLAVGDTVGTNNGMAQSVFDLLEDLFRQRFMESLSEDPLTVEGDPGYSGPGYEIWVPVLGFTGDGQDGCPPQAITGDQEIVGWTRMVLTQVINHGQCAVNSAHDAIPGSLCPPSNGTAETIDPDLRGIFGYYDCEIYDAPPVREPGPRSALATRHRLVK